MIASSDVTSIIHSHAVTSEDIKTISLYGLTSLIGDSILNANCKLQATI
jgi:hypothetical protein